MVPKGWYTNLEGERLVWMADRMPTEPMVEIGTAWGLSAFYVLAGTDSRVVCVDTWEDPAVLDEFCTTLKQEGWEDRVTLMHQPSEEAAKTWDAPIGLLHIDASHEYEDVRTDYLSWAPHVACGGWIAFHDCQTKGVHRVLKEEVWPSGWWMNGKVTNGQWSAQRRG